MVTIILIFTIMMMIIIIIIIIIIILIIILGSIAFSASSELIGRMSADSTTDDDVNRHPGFKALGVESPTLDQSAHCTPTLSTFIFFVGGEQRKRKRNNYASTPLDLGDSFNGSTDPPESL